MKCRMFSEYALTVVLLPLKATECLKLSRVELASEASRVVHQERAPALGDEQAPVGKSSGTPAKLPFIALKLLLQWKMTTERQTGIFTVDH